MGSQQQTQDAVSASRTLRFSYFSNEFPHDDLHGLLRKLRQHGFNTRHPILAKFMDEATRALREEVKDLPTELRSLIPAFESIISLADETELRKGPLNGSMDGVLLCLVQISAYIGYRETYPEDTYPSPQQTVLGGLGIGLLASSAISLAPTLEDLPMSGAEAIRIAFRLGVRVSEVSQNLEPLDDEEDSPDSWAYVVHDIEPEEAQKELDERQAKERTPETHRIFLSAFSRTSVTISGPPSRLKALFRTSGVFRDRKSIQLPVYSGLCHADHVYTERDADDIVWAKSRQSLNSRFWHRLPVLSTNTGKAYSATTAPQLLKQIVQELLTQKIIWDKVMAGLINLGKEMQANNLHIETFRSSLQIQELQTAYKEHFSDSEVSTEDLIPWIADESPKGAPRSSKQSKLAIVGMSCRMPGGATDTEKFWELLEGGFDVSRKIPADRFNVDTHTDIEGKRLNCSHTPYGCFIDEPGLFDAPFFNMSPREAEQTDPMQRLALVTAYEALERAGYVANRTAATNLTRIGTWYGQASDDYREVNTAQEISTYFIPGGCRAFGPGRINYFFKFSGPSFNCDTACSSSLATIQAACTALWNGEVDTVVAGGVNVLSNSDAFAGLSNGHFLTKTHNACKTWDDTADGYCRADGVGSMVIKRLEDAEADNDNIYGLILGAGTNHSAEAVSITHPHAGHQAYLYRQVLTRAGVDPMDINYVELHGTGTQAGDSEEVQSITNVFAPLMKKRSKKNPLHIGAVKANVGHGEAAAGVTAFLKVLLMLQKGAIPPHVGIKSTINTKLPDLVKRNVLIPYEKVEWSHNADKKRLAVINNFSAAGGNTSVIIEEPPQRKIAEADPRSSHTVALSAKSKVSLRGNVERMIAYLENNPDIRLADLAYSTTARRYHHNHRLAFHVSDIQELQKRLNSSLSNVDSQKPIPPTGAPPVAFVFTGQGASYKSMNLELFNTNPYFRNQILHLDSLAKRQGFPSFLPAIDGSHEKEYQHSPVITQVALTSIEIALAKYWESLGVKPEVVMGHSLGEYAALCIAGVLSAGDAVFLVGTRARLLEEKCQTGSHKMLAVKASIGQIEACIKNELPYEVACINGPMETVLSGTAQEMEALSEPLSSEGYRCMPLDVAFAFHSAQTDPILEEFEDIASSSVVFQEPKLPVISPLLGKVVYDDGTLNANYMRRATREAVNFVAALESAQEMDTVDKDTIWVEIGPHPVCVGFVKATMPSTNLAVPSIRRGEDNWTTMGQSLGTLHATGLQVGWNDFHKPFESNLRLLDLPTYAWNDKTYWIQYNGDWALTKGNNFYDAEKSPAKAQAALTLTSSIKSSTVHQIIEETIEGTSGRVVMQSDLMQPDFLAAAHGHNMNGCGVVTSSIHADIAYTLGHHLYNKLVPKSKKVDMNIANLEVTKGLVAKSNTKSPQLIQVSATTTDVNSGVVDLEWYNVADDGSINEPFATANIYYDDSREWLESWKPMKHLVEGRVETLERMAEEGAANRFSHSMAYTLFANNLVDYADKYRGMQAVVMNEFEATAEVTLTTEKGGIWTVPPYFIDSVAHLAGFIMNVSDASDTANTFCVTPGWRSMRFAKPLVAGGKYRSYVKMIPTEDDPSVYLGDVYVMEDGVVMGMVGGIKFRRYPRMLLSRFFSPPDSSAAKANDTSAAGSTQSKPNASQKAKPAPTKKASKEEAPGPDTPPTPPDTDSEPTQPSTPTEESPSRAASTPPTTAPSTTADPDSTTTKAMQIIANEAGMPFEDLEDDMYFANIGVDSLMSLVISEKFRQSLGIQVASSLFLEYPSIGALRAWLEEYYS